MSGTPAIGDEVVAEAHRRHVSKAPVSSNPARPANKFAAASAPLTQRLPVATTVSSPSTRLRSRAASWSHGMWIICRGSMSDRRHRASTESIRVTLLPTRRGPARTTSASVSGPAVISTRTCERYPRSTSPRPWRKRRVAQLTAEYSKRWGVQRPRRSRRGVTGWSLKRP